MDGLCGKKDIKASQQLNGLIREVKPIKDDTKKIKIKKIIMGIDAYQGPRKLYVQVTKDEIGTSISIENFTIPLEPLGLELKEVEK